MRRVLAWLTDAALADSVIGDLGEERQRRGVLWFWSALARVTGYIAWRRGIEILNGHPLRGSGTARHALRSLARRPLFACCTILLLALGIGANTAVFSVVQAVLLRPLPYADPEHLVLVWGGPEVRPGNRHSVMTGQYVAGIAESSGLFDSWAVVESWEGNPSAWADLVRPTGAERLRGTWVTSNFFETLGASAAHGRTFSSADGDLKVAVISDALWRGRFAADPGIIGKTVTLLVGWGPKRASYPFTIVGIMSPEFRFTYPRETEIYLPRPWSEIRSDHALTYYVVGRLERTVTPAQAQAHLTTVARTIVGSYVLPQYRDEALNRAGMLVEPINEHMRAEVRAGVWLLAGVAGLVLLIACVNLGLLLLSRTVDRRGELGVRAALGASRGRIVGQLAVECLILSAAGGLLGIATAALCLPVVRALMPPIVPRADQIRLDPIVLGFAMALMLATAFVCALGPALFVLRRDLLASVRTAAHSATGDRGVIASRRAILVLQVAVVVLLLVSSGLLLRSFWRLQHVDLGFSGDGVVTMEMRLLNPRYRDKARLASFREELLQRMRTVPGVVNAGVTSAVPMRGTDFVRVIGPAGQQPLAGSVRIVDPEYFRIIHLRLTAGRTFTERDTSTSEPVTVVSEWYGRRYFGNTSPVGRALRMDGQDVRIVGVVADTRYASAATEPNPAFYLPLVQDQSLVLLCLVAEPQPGMTAAVARGLREVVRSMDPEQPVEGATTIDQIISDSTSDRRFYAVSTGAFAFIALTLAIAGVFGVVARTVTERRRELAIRAALGAAPQRLMTLVYGYGLVPAAIGTAIGLTASLLLSQWLRSFLFEIGPTDALTYAGTAGIVFAVTVAACYVPARRTLRVQPMAVLKTD